jgi:hypothetical protein
VAWRGRCTDQSKREALTHKLLQLGSISHSLFEPPLPPAREVERLVGRILAVPQLFLSKEEAAAAGTVIELAELDTRNNSWRLRPRSDSVAGTWIRESPTWNSAASSAFRNILRS